VGLPLRAVLTRETGGEPEPRPARHVALSDAGGTAGALEGVPPAGGIDDAGSAGAAGSDKQTRASWRGNIEQIEGCRQGLRLSAVADDRLVEPEARSSEPDDSRDSDEAIIPTLIPTGCAKRSNLRREPRHGAKLQSSADRFCGRWS
jgi:hypothetical protein